MNQVSFALQKFAQKEAADSQKSVFATLKGAISLILLILAAIMHGWAVNNADLTILSVNASIGVIANAVIASKYLNEKFDWKYDLQGLCLIAIGSTMIILLSSKERQTFDLEKLLARLLRMESALYAVFVLVFYLGSVFLGYILPPGLR